MATVADELIVRIIGEDHISAPFTAIRNLLAGTAAELQNINSLSQVSFRAVGQEASFANDMLGQLLGKAVDLAQQFGGDAVSNALHFEDGLRALEFVSGKTAAETEKLGDQIKDLGLEMRRPTEELMKSAEAAARLGIAGNDLLEFVKTADQFAIGVGGSSSEAALGLARLKNIFHDFVGSGDGAIDRLRKIASALVAVDASSSATAPQLMASLSKMADAVEIGFKPDKLLAYSATLIGMGRNADLAGTQITSALNFLAKDEKMAKAAKLLGMTAKAFADMFRASPTAAFDAVIKKIGEIQDPLLKSQAAFQIFGAVGKKAIMPLSGALEQIAQFQKVASDELANGTKLVEAYELRMNSTAAVLDIVKNAWFALSQEVGAQFLPIMKAAGIAAIETIKALRGIVDQMGPIGTVMAGTGAAVLTLFTGWTLRVHGTRAALAIFSTTSTTMLGIWDKVAFLMTRFGAGGLVTLTGGFVKLAATLGPLVILMKAFEHFDVVAQGWKNIGGMVGDVVSIVKDFWIVFKAEAGPAMAWLGGKISEGISWVLLAIPRLMDMISVAVIGGISKIVGMMKGTWAEKFIDVASLQKVFDEWGVGAVGFFEKKATQLGGLLKDGLIGAFTVAKDFIRDGAAFLFDTELGASVKTAGLAVQSFFGDGKFLRDLVATNNGLTVMDNKLLAIAKSAPDAGQGVAGAFSVMGELGSGISNMLQGGAQVSWLKGASETGAKLGQDLTTGFHQGLAKLPMAAQLAIKSVLAAGTEGSDKPVKPPVDPKPVKEAAKAMKDMAMAADTERMKNSLQATDGVMKSIGSQLTSYAPLMKDMSMGGNQISGFGEHLQTKILELNRMQQDLLHEQIENARLNNKLARQKLEGTEVKKPIRIEVTGVEPAFQQLIKAVIDGIMLKAQQSGGELCC